MYFLYKNEYRNFKPAEVIIRRGLSKVERREIGRMSQFEL
jgi:hypothetical protein